MNLISDIYWTIRWKIEDALYAIKDKFNKCEQIEPFACEEPSCCKAKAKKKSVKKKKSKK
jgi:hypothetical protein